MKTRRIINLLCAVCFTIFLTGCASVTTWKNTGNTFYCVNDSRISKKADGQFILVQNVTVTKKYLPQSTFFEDITNEQFTYTFSAKDQPSDSRTYTFILEPDPSKPSVLQRKKGFLHCRKYLGLTANKVDTLPPADIALLAKDPFFMGSDGVFLGSRLFIPYQISRNDHGTAELKCYSPQKPPLILPTTYNNTYKIRMEGVSVTLLRIAMMPIPVIIDLATLPFQAIGLVLMYSLRC